MEQLSSAALWICPAKNMRAVTSDGETVAPGPEFRTEPAEDVIFGHKDHDRYLYHYTSLNAANLILGNLSLRMGDLRGTNDPKESKDWRFNLVSNHDFNPGEFDHGKLSRELSDVIKNHARVLCFCKDDENLSGDHLQDIPRRGHFKARMWAQYGGNHSGLCLVLDKKKLIETVREQCGEVINLFHGDVAYKNRNILDRQSERDYLIDIDVLRATGLETYWKLHARRYHRRLFFEKLQDWRDENEFRFLALVKSPRTIYIDINKCLYGVLFGDTCPVSTLKDTIDKLMDRGVHVMGLSWVNCSPWYDFGNLIYNFSNRALALKMSKRGYQNS